MTEVRIATPEDADEVARVLAEGFVEDPVMSWVFDEPGRHDSLRCFFGFLAREALVPTGATYLLPGSCANWTPPGTPEWPAERGDRFGAVLEETLGAPELERLGVLDAATNERHPDGSYWYLGSIASVPAVRGRGQASELLGSSLRRVDDDGLPAYLESTNPRNVPLYERHGFRVMGTIELPGGPPLTTMWRDQIV